MKDYSKDDVEGEIRITPQVLPFFEQQQQGELKPGQADQVETTLRSTERERFSSVYMPGSVISIDETMIPWRGRLVFRQYIPGKAHKYGIKMYKLATINGYTWNYLLDSGEQESTVGIGHAQAVVTKLLDGLDGCYRTVVADNYFTTISLAKYLLDHET